MPLIIPFTDGSFVALRVYIGASRCKFSAWFDESGKLIDCERIDSNGRSYPATEKQRAAVDFDCRYLKPRKSVRG